MRNVRGIAIGLQSTLIWVCLIALGPVLATSQEGAPMSTLIGERLEFQIRWGVIPAGRATLEVEQAEAGRVRLRARAESLPYLDWIYPVRDLVESTVLADGIRVESYLKRSKEGRKAEQEVLVEFDHVAGVVRYRRNGEVREPLAVPPGALDPLAGFYAFRALDLGSRTEHEMVMTDGKKLITGLVRVLGEEKVSTRAGEFQTYKVEPVMEGIGGIFKRSPGARIFIWLTVDERHLPVRLQSEVAIGKVTADLIELP